MHSDCEKSSILVVDDDKAILKLLSRILGDDFNVSLAQSGRESLDHINSNPDTAAVVMDYRMPDMTGTDAARQIKSLNPDIPIVIHTGYMEDLDRPSLKENDTAFDTSLVNFGFVFKVDNPEDEPEDWKVSIKNPEKLCVNTQLNPQYALFTWEAAKRVFQVYLETRR